MKLVLQLFAVITFLLFSCKEKKTQNINSLMSENQCKNALKIILENEKLKAFYYFNHIDQLKSVQILNNGKLPYLPPLDIYGKKVEYINTNKINDSLSIIIFTKFNYSSGILESTFEINSSNIESPSKLQILSDDKWLIKEFDVSIE